MSGGGCVTSSQGNVDHYVALSRLPAGDRDGCGEGVESVPCVDGCVVDGDNVETVECFT